MSVNWSWKRKMGEMVFEKLFHPAFEKQIENGEVNALFSVNIYEANCLGALIYEFVDDEDLDENGKPEEKYTFWGFWNDLEHFKNCVGQGKKGSGYDDGKIVYDDGWHKLVKARLNTYYNYKLYHDTNKILKMAECFTKAGIEVELYYEEPNEDK